MKKQIPNIWKFFPKYFENFKWWVFLSFPFRLGKFFHLQTERALSQAVHLKWLLFTCCRLSAQSWCEGAELGIAFQLKGNEEMSSFSSARDLVLFPYEHWRVPSVHVLECLLEENSLKDYSYTGLWVGLRQGFSTLAQLTVWGGGCNVHYLVAPLASTYYMPIAPPPMNCDDQKCLQTLTNIPRHWQMSPEGRHHLWLKFRTTRWRETVSDVESPRD